MDRIDDGLTQQRFYRTWLSQRASFEPRDFGVSLNRDEFDQRISDEFDDVYRGVWSVDDLLLHPREAARFCEEVRLKHLWLDVPDDIILRSALTRFQGRTRDGSSVTSSNDGASATTDSPPFEQISKWLEPERKMRRSRWNAQN